MEYIEREAVMQKFADYVKWSNNSDFAPVPTWNQAVQIVEDFPAANVRPVVLGHWVVVDFHTVKCPICGFEMDIMKVDDHILNHANYCTNCGTDMRKWAARTERSEDDG